MRKRVWIIAAIAVALIGGGAAFVYGGFYNVAASEPHNPLMRELLDVGMRRSVAAHAPESRPPPLGDAAMIERGLRHFEGNCISCHGAPGVPPAPMAAAMLPRPPDLGQRVGRFNDNEIFWIVRHGLKYTGMPGWPAEGRDDEVWDVVAFVRLLPEMTVTTYRALVAAGSSPDAAAPAAAVLVQHGPTDRAIAACARCHGLDGIGDGTGAYPRLDGLGGAYISAQLAAFASGDRPSGFMQAVVATLNTDELAAVGAYYGAIPLLPTAAPAPPITASVREEGGRLAAAGIPDRAVPPCASCHGNPGVAAPPLAGQNADYIARQLMLFRSGGRTANVMNQVAAGLSDGNIAAVSAYYAALQRQ